MVKHIVDKLCLFKNLGRHAWSGIWNLFSGKNLDVFETCYPALDKPNFDLWKPIKDFGCVLIVDFVPNFHNGVSGSKKVTDSSWFPGLSKILHLLSSWQWHCYCHLLSGIMTRARELSLVVIIHTVTVLFHTLEWLPILGFQTKN